MQPTTTGQFYGGQLNNGIAPTAGYSNSAGGSLSAAPNADPNVTYNTFQTGSNTAPTTQAPGNAFQTNPTTNTTTPTSSTQNPSTSTTGTNTANPTLSDPADRQALSQSQADQQTAAQNFANTITNIQNGTIPLSAGEQAQVQGLQQSFQTLIDQQNQQNAGASGIAQTRGYQTGAAEYDPTFQAKTIGSIVSAGQAKIADLNIKMASAVASLTQSLKDNDISKIKDAYDILNQASKDRQTALTKTIDDTTKAISDAQAEQDKQQQYNLDVQKFNKDISDTQFNQTLDTKKFEETLKSDAFDRAYKMEDLALKKQAQNGSTTQNNLPQVTLQGNGAPNAQSQQQFLASLPGGSTGAMATGVKALANYTINPATFSSRVPAGQTESQRQQMVTLAQQYDPTFDETQYNSRQATRTNFESGAYSKNINSLNTAIGHIADLSTTLAQLGNVGFTPANLVKNTVANVTGSGKITAAETNLSAAVSELATTFKGSGATDAEIKSLGNIGPNSSPDQQKAYIEKATQLLSSRLDALTQTYSSAMGKPPATPFLNDSSAKSLLGLQAQGLNIDVPALSDTPAGQVITAGKQNPQLQSNILAMEKDGQPSQAILDWINQSNQ